jgi:hypothetical protein
MIFGRPLIRLSAQYKALLDECRADLAQLHFEHRCRVTDLERELAQVRAEFEELKAAVRARQKAQAELDGLYRERELQRALAAPRDLATPLQ